MTIGNLKKNWKFGKKNWKLGKKLEMFKRFGNLINLSIWKKNRKFEKILVIWKTDWKFRKQICNFKIWGENLKFWGKKLGNLGKFGKNL